MKSPCKQCLVSPCCTRRCDDKVEYKQKKTKREEKILTIVQEAIAVFVVFGLFFSPLWLYIVSVFIKGMK